MRELSWQPVPSGLYPTGGDNKTTTIHENTTTTIPPLQKAGPTYDHGRLDPELTFQKKTDLIPN